MRTHCTDQEVRKATKTQEVQQNKMRSPVLYWRRRVSTGTFRISRFSSGSFALVCRPEIETAGNAIPRREPESERARELES